MADACGGTLPWASKEETEAELSNLWGYYEPYCDWWNRHVEQARREFKAKTHFDRPDLVSHRTPSSRRSA